MSSTKFFISLFFVANLCMSGCHGGPLGALLGTAACHAICDPAYLACVGVTAGGSKCEKMNLRSNFYRRFLWISVVFLAVATAGAAFPLASAVLAACTAAEAACLASCIAVFAVGTGPVWQLLELLQFNYTRISIATPFLFNNFCFSYLRKFHVCFIAHFLTFGKAFFVVVEVLPIHDVLDFSFDVMRVIMWTLPFVLLSHIHMDLSFLHIYIYIYELIPLMSPYI